MNAPITHYLSGNSFPITRTSVTQRIVSELFCVIISGLVVTVPGPMSSEFRESHHCLTVMLLKSRSCDAAPICIKMLLQNYALLFVWQHFMYTILVILLSRTHPSP